MIGHSKITKLYKDANGKFYIDLVTHPHTGSTEKISNKEAINLQVGMSIKTNQYWDDLDSYHIDVIRPIEYLVKKEDSYVKLG